MIQTKAKQEENSKEIKPSPKKKEVSEKSIYFALNSYMKSCFLSSRKSSVRVIVDRWLTSVQHNLKKELKNIAEVVGKKVKDFDRKLCNIQFSEFFQTKTKTMNTNI